MSDFDVMREIRRGGSAHMDSSGNATFTRGPLHWTDQLRDDRAALIAYIRDLEEHHIEDSDFAWPDVMQDIRELRAKHPRIAEILGPVEDPN